MTTPTGACTRSLREMARRSSPWPGVVSSRSHESAWNLILKNKGGKL